MIHGLMWFPLLAIFAGLAWAGWNEYQKIEQYKRWVGGAERAKYDIRAALMQKDGMLIWGKPSRKGILDIQTLAVTTIDHIAVKVDQETIELDHPPDKGTVITIELTPSATASTNQPSSFSIPFTDIALAIQWAIVLKQEGSQ